jgi:hypothetical protein
MAKNPKILETTVSSILDEVKALAEPKGDDMEAAFTWAEIADTLKYIAQQCETKSQEIAWTVVKTLGSEYYTETGKYEVKEGSQVVTHTAPATMGEAIRKSNGNKVSWFCRWNKGENRPSLVFRGAFERRFKIGSEPVKKPSSGILKF